MDVEYRTHEFREYTQVEDVTKVVIKVGNQTFEFGERNNSLAVRVIGGGVRVGSVAHNVMTIHQEFD